MERKKIMQKVFVIGKNSIFDRNRPEHYVA